jgi:ATP-dependent DNA helicase RecG
MDTPERLVALVDQLASSDAELPYVEFKVNNYDPDRIGTLVSAISNAACLHDQPFGYVIWGINDDKHEIVGTTFRPFIEKAHGQPLELWLSNSINPSVHMTFKEVAHPRGRVIILEIPRALMVSTKFRNIAFIRIGATTPKLVDHQALEASLNAKLQPYIWERGIAESFVETRKVMELLDVATYFSLTQQAVPGNDEAIAQVLAHDNLIQRDVGGRWNILNLGAVLFARNIQNFGAMARKTVRVFRYAGQSRSGTETAHEQSGIRGYAIGFDPLIAHITKRLPKKEVITRSLRVPQPIFPEIAIRELVANALLHQDMTISGAGPLIEIFSDRIEITNPGSPLVDTRRFIDFPPRSRNEGLAGLMRRIGICEERGSGVDRAINAIEEARLPPADIRADGQSTKLTIFGPKSFGELTYEERVVGSYQHASLKFVNTRQGITNSSLRVRFGVAERNSAQISRVLNRAVEVGLLKPSDNWSARAGSYLPWWA